MSKALFDFLLQMDSRIGFSLGNPPSEMQTAPTFNRSPKPVFTFICCYYALIDLIVEHEKLLHAKG